MADKQRSSDKPQLVDVLASSIFEFYLSLQSRMAYAGAAGLCLAVASYRVDSSLETTLLPFVSSVAIIGLSAGNYIRTSIEAHKLAHSFFEETGRSIPSALEIKKLKKEMDKVAIAR